MQRHRGSYIVPGPNYVWSIDGHCKLDHWGFQIYAAIDAYSRFVIWVYVGISSHTAKSVLRQYVNAVAQKKVVPHILRSDRGVETTMIAAAHYELRKCHDPEMTIGRCYRYGTSTANQRIEAWWNQLTRSLLFRWRVSLHHCEDGALVTTGLPANEKYSDRAIFDGFPRTDYGTKILPETG